MRRPGVRPPVAPDGGIVPGTEGASPSCSGPISRGVDPACRGAPDGRIVLGNERAGLSFVPAAGGTPQTLTTVDSEREMTHRLPRAVAGGRGLVFTALRNPSDLETHIEWLSLETGQRKLLVEDAADGRYVPTGHLVFVRRGALMAVPFDLAGVRTTGPAVTVMPRVMQAFNTNQVIPFAASKADEANPDFSPDSRWLAYVSKETGRNEVYVRSFPDGKRTVQITTAG